MKNSIANLLAATVVLCSQTAAAGDAGTPAHISSIRADSPQIVYEGRTVSDCGSVRFDWSGVIVRVNFTGSRLEMSCDDSKCDWFNLWTDKPQSEKQDTVFSISGTRTVILAEGLEYGSHSIILQKRTEGEQGCLTIRQFATDGHFDQASDPFTRHIEFIGDSYTCGYGTEAADRDQPFRACEENCNLAYAAIAGRFFDAGIRTISHSGRGLVRNYGGAAGPTVTDRYAYSFDEAQDNIPWAPDAKAADGAGRTDTGWNPDIVVVYLGTNDFSCGEHPALKEWCRGTEKLISRIRANYGDEVPVLFVASKASDLLADYVRTAVGKTAYKNIFWTAVHDKAHNDEDDLGASWHPNYEGQRKVACCMIPYISTLAGWEMPRKEIR